MNTAFFQIKQIMTTGSTQHHKLKVNLLANEELLSFFAP